ncbi:ribonuclease III [Anaerotalea alkaliphila]|uniref:Ribonuclease 3 n=1 Tax=Anaerotalea alkaliphila TaxID=2662126 RepID=A0A7X5HUH2_9FIRM|nr:ribonuclease III [Anaerotalea alkaliphila]NDL66868.1 ribonuclease III [Anaerotalea alkaliphila]
MTKRRNTQLENKIGYAFNDRTLMATAMIHSSYANEKKLKKTESNERLEFLGDAVLELVTSDHLYASHPELSEGELTKRRAGIVCEPTLAAFAREIGLGSSLLLGKGEDASGGRERNSILSDAMEALIGAVYLDGGLEEARRFVHRHLLDKKVGQSRLVDSKTQLQELLQASSDVPLEYRVVLETGPDHEKSFAVEVLHGGKVIGAGLGRNKKSAEQQAAADALEKFQESGADGPCI